MLDLKITVDDVPLGLSMQTLSAFKFASSRLWMKHIPDVTLTTNNLHKVLDLSVRILPLVLCVCVIIRVNG